MNCNIFKSLAVAAAVIWSCSNGNAESRKAVIPEGHPYYPRVYEYKYEVNGLIYKITSIEQQCAEFLGPQEDKNVENCGYYDWEDHNGKLIIADRFKVGNNVYTVTAVNVAYPRFGWSDEKLTELVIPNSVKAVGAYNAFEDCSNLKHVVFGNSVSRIEQYAFDSTGIVDLVIPKSVKEIEHGAFDNCRELKNVTINGEISVLNEGVFEFCVALTSVTMPASLTRICEDAFLGCPIKKIVCHAVTPPQLEGDAFDKDDIGADAVLYVPASSVSKYKDSPWSQYFSKIEAL